VLHLINKDYPNRHGLDDCAPGQALFDLPNMPIKAYSGSQATGMGSCFGRWIAMISCGSLFVSDLGPVVT